MISKDMYDYLEERPIGQVGPGKRRKKVAGKLARGTTPASIDDYHFSQWPWRKAREFERRASAPDSEGAWPINHNRVSRYYGDPGQAVCPGSNPNQWPENIEYFARSFRLHHYFRVWGTDDCRELALQGIESKVGLEITEEWHDPPDGIIELPPDSSPVVAAHAIPINRYDFEHQRFPFTNSWGESWGDRGRGAIAAAYVDRFLIEGWCLSWRGVEPPTDAVSGLVCLLWKTGLVGREVHGREVVNAGTGERIAWAFLTRQGGYLDLEEFFVWPAHRRQGFGRRLAEMVRELAGRTQTRLRAWIPFADAYPDNRPALVGSLGVLGLHLHPSPRRSAAFVAVPEPYAANLTEPRFPDRPATIRDKLDPQKGTRLYTVWFGTNRKPAPEPAAGFTGERDDKVHYGFCKVAIPKSPKFGSVGPAWWKFWKRWSGDALEVVQRSRLDAVEFWRQLADDFRQRDIAERQGLVFVHGYNVNFDYAAIRAAQIGFDLKVPGATAFFSWPSCGALAGYSADEACIEASERFIAEFLCDFVSKSGAERVHLIAHSMGNRGLLRALQRISAEVTDKASVQFGQIILAAPDIDAGLFRDLATVYQRFAGRTTLYASRADLPVSISKLIHRYNRAGLTPPVTVVSGIDTIEVPRFNVFDLLGHGYYAEAEGLLHDMFDLIRRNAPPADRQRLDSATTLEGLEYWTMRA